MKKLLDDDKGFKGIFLDFLKSPSIPLLFFIIFAEFTTLDSVSVLFFSGPDSDSQRILKAFSQLIITLPFAIFIYTYVYWELGKKYSLTTHQDFSTFFSNHFLEWFLVQIRSFSRVIMYSFLLLIPGVVESMRLCFAPLNVFYNENMKDPYYDPIIESRNTIPPVPKIIFILFFFTFLFPFLINIPFSERSFFTEPVVRMFHVLSATFTVAFSQCYIFYKYTQMHNKNEITFKE